MRNNEDVKRRVRGCNGWQYAVILLGMVSAMLLGCGNSSQAGTSKPTGNGQSTPTATRPGFTPTATQPPFIPTATAVVNWTTLEQKPLKLPSVAPGSPCPVTPSQRQIAPDYGYALGQGPVYMVGQTPITQIQEEDAGALDVGSPWKIAKVTWEVAASYQGPAIIRGQQIDGTHALSFNGGLGQTKGNPEGTEPLLTDLHLYGNGQWAPYVTFLRTQAAGCYAFQIDGATFSTIIVMQAILA